MNHLGLISFHSNPIRTHDMEYECDAKKDKPLQGEDNECPVVRLEDKLCRSGELKVVSISHMPANDNCYPLHTNLLCGDPKAKKYCNDVGVGSYKFENKSGCIFINLVNLCIRHSRKNSVDGIKKKWLKSIEKFDPFGIGFGDTDSLDYQKIRLCCQIFFNNTKHKTCDNTKSNILVSDTIFNGPSDIKIEFWDDKREVKANSNNELLYALVRKVSTEQRRIFARFFDNTGWKERVEPEHNQHDYTFVFKIPPYKNELIDENVFCNFQLSVIGKEFYRSEVKQFLYIPIFKPNKSDISRGVSNIQHNNNFNSDKQLVQSCLENTNLCKIDSKVISDQNISETNKMKRKIKEANIELKRMKLIKKSSLLKNFLVDKPQADEIILSAVETKNMPFKKYLTAKYQIDNSNEALKKENYLKNQLSFGKSSTKSVGDYNNDLKPNVLIEFLTKQNFIIKKELLNN